MVSMEITQKIIETLFYTCNYAKIYSDPFMLQEVWLNHVLVYMLAVLHVYFCFWKMFLMVFYLFFFKLVFLYIILNRFDILILKINFKKIKKYYFYIFLNKKYLKKTNLKFFLINLWVLIESLTCPTPFCIYIQNVCSGRGWLVWL